MKLFAKLFDSLLVFVYHCFDRIVIHGYLSGLSRPEQVVYFFRDVVGVPVVDKTVLFQRTGDYRHWVDAFARNHQTPIEWAQKGPQRELRPALVPPHGARRPLWRLFHFPEHGTGRHFPLLRSQVPYPGSKPPDSTAAAQPVHALLFLPAG